MAFEIQLEQFDGPLHLLLELIESEQLPITEISLSHVTDAYLRHIDAHTPPPEELADFLLVATRLLLLKSRVILPIKIEEEEDPGTLALQLRLYKEFVEASKSIEALFDAPSESFVRLKADRIESDTMVVPKGLDCEALHASFTSLLKRLEPFFKLQQSSIERVVSVKERLREIHDAVLSRSRMTFREVVGKSTSRVDVVVSFLALLELVKQRVVHVIQNETFHDIEIKKVD